jgi:XTP/dITP diphosphohydrolase
MRELLLATGNKGKIPGLIAGLGDVPFKILTLNEVKIPEGLEVEEPGSTYEAHAAIKAFVYSKHTGYMSLADDSGLEIDALKGEPGVHTAHYFSGTRDERVEAMLEKLKDIPVGARQGRYRCVIAIYDPKNDKIRFAEGVTEGVITTEAKGTNGFGYDPIFQPEGFDKTFGELALEEVLEISHRGRALAKAREILMREFAV